MIHRELRDWQQLSSVVEGATIRFRQPRWFTRCAREVDQPQVKCQNRAQFFAIAANLMRQILVDHARCHLAPKRGCGKKVGLEQVTGVAHRRDVEFVALGEAADVMSRAEQP